jgi:hypothetical protein
MAKTGRPSLLIPTVEWKVRVPIDLAAKADMLCWDPVKATIAYGARSALVTELLRGKLDNLGKHGDNNDAVIPPINPLSGVSHD